MSLSIPYVQGRQSLLARFILVLAVLFLNESVASGFQAVARTRRSPVLSWASETLGEHENPYGSQRIPYLPPWRNDEKGSSSFQSEYTNHAKASSSGGVRNAAQGMVRQHTSTNAKKKRIASHIISVGDRVGVIIQEWWWCFPMILALVPPYCALVLKTAAAMPDWWALVKLDHIARSPSAAMVIGVFLGSNISYFISGTYLYLRYNRTSGNGDPLLGASVLTAGAVSTVFHSVQALGPHTLAECLCFIDHAVAISSILYFWNKCGRPSRTTVLLSIAGFVTLALSGPGYAWLHSAWHVLSAATAVVWARDRFDTRGNTKDCSVQN